MLHLLYTEQCTASDLTCIPSDCRETAHKRELTQERYIGTKVLATHPCLSRVGCTHPSFPLPKNSTAKLHTSGAEIARQVWGRTTHTEQVQGKSETREKKEGDSERKEQKDRMMERRNEERTTHTTANDPKKTERANCIAPRPRQIRPRKGSTTHNYSLNNFHQTEALLLLLIVLVFLCFASAMSSMYSDALWRSLRIIPWSWALSYPLKS